ncbi:RHS repeat-associated core domain-containing protein [Paenibacillus sp. 481]|uniref:RHS repeat-associated core domain-containing protein n=1 Tax=Paenibacillus sp. 481 TaxID=2835869 RepID=UPI001E2E1986|nr:RHS repeat-associated core domain-containing protein [Paenibacillus sp. 481]UHA74523.1 hypothetical protein KIK04_05330 [Paenibacillus sp. 481]
MIQIQYSDGTVSKKKYDEIGCLIEQIDPKNVSKRFYHDANNNLVKSIDRKGQVHQFGYSNRNFLTSSTTPIPEEGVTYAYDEGGNRTAMTDATGTTRYAYFPTGELRTITYPDQTTLSYEYEARSLRTKQTVTTPTFSSSMTVNYGTMFAHPTSLQVTDRNNTALATMNYTYDKSETNLAKLSMSNGITETYTYDGLNLAHIQQHQGATPFGQYQYSYDPNRNITRKNENGTPFTFTYDKLNRIQTNSQFSETYTYDARDNRSTLTTANPPVQKGAQYSYDSCNRLTRAVTEDGNVVTYRYNGDGLMVERSQAGETTRYYYDDRKIIVAEGKVEPSGTVTITYAYAHDPRGRLLARQVASTNQMQYYVTNGHGDVTEIRDSQGTVLNKYTYDIWGKPLVTDKEQVPNIFRYSGEYWDSATNLQYLRSRWYDPSTGRFTTEDTYEGKLSSPLSLNLYAYVENNPLIWVDPTGHAKASDNKHLAGLVQGFENKWKRAQHIIDNFRQSISTCFTATLCKQAQSNFSYIEHYKNLQSQYEMGADAVRVAYYKLKRSGIPNDVKYRSSSVSAPNITSKLNSLIDGFNSDFKDYSANAATKLKKFWSLVETGSRVDVKNSHFKGHQFYTYDSELYRRDDLGNIFFGYAGKVFGYSDSFLTAGAGGYQIYSGTSQWSYYSTWFDDPRDSAMIGVGVSIYNKSH